MSTPANTIRIDHGSPIGTPKPQGALRSLSGQVGVSIVATLVLTLLVSVIYPLVVWGISQVVFNHKANGSLIVDKDGKVRGSSLLAQAFTGEQYFHPRPSAAGSGYAADASSGTNLGPTSVKLIDGLPDDPATADKDESFAGVRQLVEQYRKTNGLAPDAPVPADAVTRSSSGLDPHISQANALFQAPRVAKARDMALDDVKRLIEQNTDGRDLGLLGEAGVNVVRLNLALDTARKRAS
jgi:K+-transporting ATPase ATPase C chain